MQANILIYEIIQHPILIQEIIQYNILMFHHPLFNASQDVSDLVSQKFFLHGGVSISGCLINGGSIFPDKKNAITFLLQLSGVNFTMIAKSL